MRVRMRATMAGPGGVFEAGQVVELDDAIAMNLIAGGYAEPAAPRVPETATAEPPERAVLPTPARRRKSPA